MSDFEKGIVQKLMEAGIDSETADKVVNAILKADDDNPGSAACEAMDQAAQAIADLMTKPGFVNLDPDDVKQMMEGVSLAYVGHGTANGKNKAIEAAEKALDSLRLPKPLTDIRKFILGITTSPDTILLEMTSGAEVIKDKIHPDAYLLWGHCIDEGFGDNMSVTIIALA